MANKKINNNGSNKKPVDFILVITVLIMLALGIVMVLSASSPSALAETGNSYKYVMTQGFSAIVRFSFDGNYFKNRLQNI